ncbi:MAG: ATP-binding protein [Chloroflexi bacterium]|nr:ATP-binding protein [Chloroflexota bacterium]
MEVAAIPQALDEVHACLGHFWLSLAARLPEALDEDWRLHFTTAVAEIAANIIRYAYAEQPAPGRFRLRLRASSGQVEAHFTDWGVPFTPRETRVAPPAHEAVDPPVGGYGLALARAAVDSVDYRRTPEGVNCWRLRKAL